MFLYMFGPNWSGIPAGCPHAATRDLALYAARTLGPRARRQEHRNAAYGRPGQAGLYAEAKAVPGLWALELKLARPFGDNGFLASDGSRSPAEEGA
jgi:hypothetical protein